VERSAAKWNPIRELAQKAAKRFLFRTMVEPSLRDLEFDAEVVARWYPLGLSRRSIVIDPARGFGRPMASDGGVPTRVLASAVEAEGSVERVARFYEIAPATVRDALTFEQKLVA